MISLRHSLASLFVLMWTQAHAELIVHEWGTFTSLQDEAGRTLGGINTDDEPVPDFVHRVASNLLIPPTEAPPTFFQGAPAAHPDVTMRLETPVLYFHCDPDEHPVVDVEVSFRGGWLTEFYPDAEVTAPGVEAGKGRFGPLTSETTGRLKWRNLRVNGLDAGEAPETQERVWLAPRRVEAQAITAPSGESEKFLFYRGVAHLEAPIITRREGKNLVIDISRKLEKPLARSLAAIKQLWLVEVQAEGSTAFRVLDKVEGFPVTLPVAFAKAAFSKNANSELQQSLQKALVADGLAPDEAAALLETWKVSYFQSVGLRLFFLVPRFWTDAVLPLRISDDPATVRTMVGRIELITPDQRRLLKQIAEGPVPDPWEDLRKPTDAATWKAGDNQAMRDLMAGRRDFESLGLKVPPVYARYLQLGRFRNALVLDECKQRPTPELVDFIEKFRLGFYSPN